MFMYGDSLEAAPDGGALGAGSGGEYCDICGMYSDSDLLQACPHCDILVCAGCQSGHEQDCSGPVAEEEPCDYDDSCAGDDDEDQEQDCSGPVDEMEDRLDEIYGDDEELTRKYYGPEDTDGV